MRSALTPIVFAVGALGAAPAFAQPSCTAASVRCVDDSASGNQEYGTIQGAVNAAQPGDTVLVFDGTYQGFQVHNSGTSAAPITIMAAGSSAIISSPTSTSDGIYLSDVDYVTIQGFRIQNMPQRCISARDAQPTAPMHGIIVRGNTCLNAGREGFYLSEITNSLVDNNTISGVGMDGVDRGHGIYLANAGSDGTTIRANRISGMHSPDSAGIHMNGDLSVGGDGIISNVTIESNVVFDGNQNGLSMDGVHDSTVRNNLIYDMARNGARAFQEDGASGPQNLRFINNTFIANDGWAIKLSEDRGGHVIFNNILLANGSNGGAVSVGSSNVTSDYNAAVNRFSRDNDSSTISLDAWKSGGDDTHSFVSTSSALFVNAASDNYHRKDGGPAVDAGVPTLNSTSAPATDLEGVPRPRGSGFDLGAYETSAGGAQTTAPAPPTNVRIIRD